MTARSVEMTIALDPPLRDFLIERAAKQKKSVPDYIVGQLQRAAREHPDWSDDLKGALDDEGLK